MTDEKRESQKSLALIGNLRRSFAEVKSGMSNRRGFSINANDFWDFIGTSYSYQRPDQGRKRRIGSSPRFLSFCFFFFL
jgi:hypothetical protein